MWYNSAVLLRSFPSVLPEASPIEPYLTTSLVRRSWPSGALHLVSSVAFSWQNVIFEPKSYIWDA
jgi:hypothetical protein